MTEENETTIVNLLKNEHILALIVCEEEGLSLKDVLELAFTSKDVYEIVKKNSDVWKHFFDHYKIDIPSDISLASFINEYKSKKL